MKKAGPPNKVEKALLGIAGEYAVATELCRRGVYAQLTLGNRKKVDLLLDGENGVARVEVKTKQEREWPGVKGIGHTDGLTFLVLVDMQGKGQDDRPDFYIISKNEWRPLVEGKFAAGIKSGYMKFDENDVPVWQKDGNGKRFVGAGLTAKDIAEFKGCWGKIVDAVGKAID